MNSMNYSAGLYPSVALDLKELSKFWIIRKSMYVKESTLSVYKEVIRRYVLPEFDGKIVTEESVQEFIMRKRDDGMSSSSVKKIVIVLKSIVRFAAKKGMVPVPDWSLIYPPDSVSDVRAYTIDDQRKLLTYLRNNISMRASGDRKRDDSLKLIGLVMCLSTGMRIGEICALRWKDIDFELNIVHVRRTLLRIPKSDGEGSHVILSTPKTQSSLRDVPLNVEVRIYLHQYINKVNPEHYLLSNDEKPMETRCYRDYYDRLTKRAGIPHLKFHALRHTFATRCVESQCDYKTVSVILGHSSITTTLDLYVHPNMDARKSVIDKMTNYVK